jgi:hypothetical protein
MDGLSARSRAEDQDGLALAGLLKHNPVAELPDVQQIPGKYSLKQHDPPSVRPDRCYVKGRYDEERPEPDRDCAAKCRFPRSEDPLDIIEVEDVEGYRIEKQCKGWLERIDGNDIPAEIYSETDTENDGERYQHHVSKQEEPAVPGKTQRHV